MLEGLAPVVPRGEGDPWLKTAAGRVYPNSLAESLHGFFAIFFRALHRFFAIAM
jgi:hypothetical protein